MKYDNGYPCPACGAVETEVMRTISLSGGIFRERGCRVCGHRHGTIEMPVEGALRRAMKIVLASRKESAEAV